ncbi:hypothetical protein, partial [Aeromonas caviae]|uniref:hypothetical protein n=1 Tax=Aeromonas caviae TaxID=648 RepID=UPI0025B66FCC
VTVTRFGLPVCMSGERVAAISPSSVLSFEWYCVFTHLKVMNRRQRKLCLRERGTSMHLLIKD